MTVYAASASANGNPYVTAVLADNPIAYWRCNEPVGSSTLTDTQGVLSTGYSVPAKDGIGRQGALAGDRTAGSVGLVANSSTPIAGFASTSAFNVAPFTAEFWIMTASTGSSWPISLSNNASSPFNGYQIGINQGQGAGKIVIWDSHASAYVATAATVNDGAWHHIVVTYSGSTVTTYKDGVSTGTVTLAAPVTPFSGTGMGLLYINTQQPPVYISEVAVYASVLSSGRVAAHYNAALAFGLQDRVELLTATQTWENGLVLEPNLYRDDNLTGGTGKWCMVYRGGSTSCALGYATCPGGSDPTVPGNWTKYSGNPIVGSGVGGFSDPVYCPSIYIEAGTLYVTFTDFTTGDIYICSGPDALHLGTPTKIFTHTTGACGNMWVVKNGSTYYLFIEMQTSGTWQIGYATSSTVNGTYTFQSFFTLSDGQTDHSGPWAKFDGTTYQVWYHGSNYNTGLPSQIYKTTTANLSTFTTPQLQFRRSHHDEFDQTADPQLVIPGQPEAPASGPLYLVWDADDNVNVTASIFISRSGVVPVAA